MEGCGCVLGNSLVVAAVTDSGCVSGGEVSGGEGEGSGGGCAGNGIGARAIGNEGSGVAGRVIDTEERENDSAVIDSAGRVSDSGTRADEGRESDSERGESGSEGWSHRSHDVCSGGARASVPASVVVASLARRSSGGGAPPREDGGWAGPGTPGTRETRCHRRSLGAALQSGLGWCCAAVTTGCRGDRLQGYDLCNFWGRPLGSCGAVLTPFSRLAS